MIALEKLKEQYERVCAGVGYYVNIKCPKLSLAFFGAGSLVAAYEGLVEFPNYLLGVGGAGLAAGALLLAKDKVKTAAVALLSANALLAANGVFMMQAAANDSALAAGALLALSNGGLYAAANFGLLRGENLFMSHERWSFAAATGLAVAAGLLGDNLFLFGTALPFVIEAFIRNCQTFATNSK